MSLKKKQSSASKKKRQNYAREKQILLPTKRGTSSPVKYYHSRIKERALGILVLLTVPLAWGTYTPVVKYMYAFQPPVPGFVFSAAYYVVASVSLWFLASIQQIFSRDEKQQHHQQQQEDNTKVKATAARKAPPVDPSDGLLLVQGGLELGAYMFLGNVLQVIGLKTVSAGRAGFLVQLTTVMVPFMEAGVSKDLKSVSNETWMACLLAFTGVVIINLDGKEAADGSTSTSALLIQDGLHGFTVGDSLIMLAAVSYSLHVVRLERYATATMALQLAASKATAEAIFSVGIVLALMAPSSEGTETTSGTSALDAFTKEEGDEITAFFATLGDSWSSGSIPISNLVPVIGAVLWTGWVSCAYCIFAQSFGQQRINPTQANLIYGIQPLFTVIFAFVMLGETLSLIDVIGGALIAVAVYLVAKQDEDAKNKAAASETM